MTDLTPYFVATASEVFSWLSTEHRLTRYEAGVQVRQRAFASVPWTGEQLFVEVILEIPRPALDVQFGPMVRGRIPDASDLDARFHLDQLVAIAGSRTDRTADLPTALAGLRRAQIRSAMVTASQALRPFASQLAAGDRALFSELRNLSRQTRAAKWRPVSHDR